MNSPKRFRIEPADGFLLLTALLWGINIPVVKFATYHMDELGFNALRMILSTATLGICWWIEVLLSKRRASPDLSNALKTHLSPSGGSRANLANALENATPEKIVAADPSVGPAQSVIEQPASPTQTRRPMAIGSLIVRVISFSIFSGLLYPLAFMQGIDRTTAGNTALLLASMPMWTAILSMLFLRERLNKLTWSGLAITFFGTLLIIQARGGIELSAQYLTGNLFMLAGAIIWASATVISSPLLKQLSPLKLAFISAAITTPVHVATNWGVIVDQFSLWTQPGVFASVVYSGILSTGIAYASWNAGVRRVGGSHAAVYQNIVTLVAVLISWMVLGEPVLMLQVLGGAIAIAGLFIIRKGRA